MQPIWKDYFVNLGNDRVIDFRILKNGNEIYIGRSVMRPDADDNIIRLNDILADYMSNLPTFTIRVKSSGTWTDVDEVEMNNDWSYDENFDFDSQALSQPINGICHPFQDIFYTASVQDGHNVTLHYADGTSYTSSESPVRTGGNDFLDALAAAGVGYIPVNPSESDDIVKVVIEDTDGMHHAEYVVNRNTCSRYALFYRNAFGGFDSLLLEGNDQGRDEVEHKTYNKDFDNTNSANREKVNYLNNIVRSMTLHTGILTDEESKKMHHLLESPEVFLWDAESIFERIPVVITDSTIDRKTYKSNGMVMNSYEINIEFADNRIRR